MPANCHESDSDPPAPVPTRSHECCASDERQQAAIITAAFHPQRDLASVELLQPELSQSLGRAMAQSEIILPSNSPPGEQTILRI